jgi:hypothetical protein
VEANKQKQQNKRTTDETKSIAKQQVDTLYEKRM